MTKVSSSSSSSTEETCLILPSGCSSEVVTEAPSREEGYYYQRGYQQEHRGSKQQGRLAVLLIGIAVVAVLGAIIAPTSNTRSSSGSLLSFLEADASSPSTPIAFGEISVTPIADTDQNEDESSKKSSSSSSSSPPPPQDAQDTATITTWQVPRVQQRCDWVMARFAERFAERDVGTSPEELAVRYRVQSVNENVFYRATAHIFWRDFVDGKWGQGLILNIKDDVELEGDKALDARSTWTWVTGDQHLSNFGAWRNRHGDVVFGYNDFDEAAIYDFQVDILRIAVSILNHAVTNGLKHHEVEKALKVFTKAYVDTVVGYVGNEDALLFELTEKTTSGKLHHFLKDVENDKSTLRQMQKFTHKDDDNDGTRYFIKGDTVGEPHPKTRLAPVTDERLEELKEAFSSTKYGATMMQLGWAVRQWDDDFFTILDVAERIGSGVGSYGVNRYYVLLKGRDGLLDDGVDGSAVVLDVKFEPKGAVMHVLTPHERAWYDNIFPNSAARTVEAQRRLTSYTDPYTGWIELADNETGTLQPYAVRQRSPWKDSFDDLDKLTKAKEFNDYMAQIAKATATSHVRGSVAKTPGDFKTVIKALLGKHKNREAWTKGVTVLASAYHEQVELDFQCFKDYVKTKYPEDANKNGDDSELDSTD